ncbi:MAG: hypothetical protein LBK72_04315 [Bifidobacteriaceae bacterium]|nr:hypothetical protein [Bifidobacteriaceae bacterium]
MLSVSDSHTAVIDAQGSVWSWGDSSFGKLGAPVTARWTATPVRAVGLTDAVSISAPYRHAVAATADGRVWTWGANSSGVLGTAVDPGQSDSTVPIEVPELTDVTQVAAAAQNSYAVTASGLLQAWGSNANHLLGNGGTADSSVPVLVQGPTDVVAVSASHQHVLALTDSGDVWAWGNNSNGELGTVSSEAVRFPRRVEGISPMKAVAAGNGFSLAVDTAGNVWGWGRRLGLILEGDDIDPDSMVPIQIPGLHDVVQVAANASALAVTNSGEVWTWGSSEFAHLGHGTLAAAKTPTRVNLPEPVVAGAMSRFHVAVLTTSGTLYTWGNNYYFQLGDESSTTHLSPTRVNGITGVWRV